MRRVAILLALACTGVACSSGPSTQPLCAQPGDSILVLEAQSVPSATRLPCIAELPIGWMFSGSLVRDDGTTLWLDHDRAGLHAVEVVLTARCDVSGAIEVPPGPDEVGLRVFQEPTSLDPFVATRSLVFQGGCIQYRYRFASGSEPALVIEADRALSSLPRIEVVNEVRRNLDLSLCGAEAPPCES